MGKANPTGWLQTIVAIVSFMLMIAGTAWAAATWIQKNNQAILDILSTHQRNQDILNRWVAERLTTMGFSRKDAIDHRNALAKVADHPVPTIEIPELKPPFEIRDIGGGR